MPINKNDKVDMLIQQMKENSILMDLDADNAIRIAIKKMSAGARELITPFCSFPSLIIYIIKS